MFWREDPQDALLRSELSRIATFPASDRSLLAMGTLHEQLGDPNAALELYQQALTLLGQASSNVYRAPRNAEETNWRQMQLMARVTRLTGTKPRRATLEITHHGKTTMVHAPVCVLGRGSRTTDVCIPAPTVAYEHCVIWSTDSTWWLRNLSATNGTLVSGTRISKPVRLGAHTIVALADQEVGISLLVDPSS